MAGELTDESPETHENYRQSERLPLHKNIHQLLAEGKAYKSYVTEVEELAAERERQEAAGETPRYINEFLAWLKKKAAYIAEREAAGIVNSVWRLTSQGFINSRYR